MGAVQVFDALHVAGLSVSLAPGGGLVVAPGSRLTPDLRELVKANKSALVDWLNAANDPASPDANSRFVGLDRSVLPMAEKIAEPELAQPPAPAPAPAPDKPAKKLKYLDWADGWIELDKAYQRHHFACPTCIAAGKGYGLRCGAGAALWQAYEGASWE